MNPARAGQRGQALTESVLVLPLLLLLGWSLLQLGWVLWMRVLLQHAAHSAARAYTVWQPLDAEAAQQRARRAAAMVLGSALEAQGLELDIQPGTARKSGDLDPSQPGVHQLRLEATLLIPGPLGRHWHLRASSSILREDALTDVNDSDQD